MSDYLADASFFGSALTSVFISVLAEVLALAWLALPCALALWLAILACSEAEADAFAGAEAAGAEAAGAEAFTAAEAAGAEAAGDEAEAFTAADATGAETAALTAVAEALGAEAWAEALAEGAWANAEVANRPAIRVAITLVMIIPYLG